MVFYLKELINANNNTTNITTNNTLFSHIKLLCWQNFKSYVCMQFAKILDLRLYLSARNIFQLNPGTSMKDKFIRWSVIYVEPLLLAKEKKRKKVYIFAFLYT